MKEIIKLIKNTPRYKKNILYGQPRFGHPEGKVEKHIEDLEENLNILSKIKNISEEDFWKLEFLIHLHDTFKVEVKKDSSILYKRSHTTLAREFAKEFTDDIDLLNMLQFHDWNYKLWKEYIETGSVNTEKFQFLLGSIDDWNLFLIFIIIDGCVEGKDRSKIPWFISEVCKHKTTKIDASWVLPQEKRKTKQIKTKQ